MDDKTTVSRNESYTIQELSSLVRSGRIRIPDFQRSFRWESADVLSLFDSILRGYPFGSFLLWKRPALEAEITIGALRLHAPARNDALWVVDGQQRITSLVNAIDPDASHDERFRIHYSLTRHQVVNDRSVDSDLAIPLPDLFDFGRALRWLSQNPDASDYAEQVQLVAGQLNRVEASSAVIEQGDEHVLRDVFDRINSRGKRLNAAEIFDAIHSSTTRDPHTAFSLSSIASRVNQSTNFGLLDPKTVVQALLVRRHPDITRDVHSEFTTNRASESTFPGETEIHAYRNTESALLDATRYLQNQIGIPHLSFLPFRFQLLVLVRFFAFFPEPSTRNLELLRRWFWRSSVAAGVLNLTGSTGNVRSLAGYIRAQDESGSIQRLLAGTLTGDAIPLPDVDAFRTNHSTGKVILAALWALGPVNPESGEKLSQLDLANALENDTSPSGVALELFPPTGELPTTRNAANRVIAAQSRQDFIGSLSDDSDLASHLLDHEMLSLLERDRRQEFLGRRAVRLKRYLEDFIRERTGDGLELTPPLADLDLDQDGDDELVDLGTRRD